MDEALFDRIADEELRHLESKLGALDPDEVEVDVSSGVLTLTLGGGGTVVVNSHRAARQIWLAAFRRAWHFTPARDGDTWRWRTETDDLRATLGKLLGDKLGRRVDLE